jgi:hypothetical protein
MILYGVLGLDVASTNYHVVVFGRGSGSGSGEGFLIKTR